MKKAKKPLNLPGPISDPGWYCGPSKEDLAREHELKVIKLQHEENFRQRKHEIRMAEIRMAAMFKDG